jgi:membrane protease YdiL (CAAX protease family)
LLFEFLAFFIVLPTSLWFLRSSINYFVIPMIILAAVVCWLAIRRTPGYVGRPRPSKTLWRRLLVAMLIRFVVLGGIVTAAYFWSGDDRILQFPRKNPGFWLVIMCCYPVFSAFPQEFIFRAFIYHRYSALFTSRAAFIAASAVSFGLAHLFLSNWVAPVMSAVGGALFAWTYHRSGSILLASLEHGLWGDLLFTVGLGWYFYGGSVRA